MELQIPYGPPAAPAVGRVAALQASARRLLEAYEPLLQRLRLRRQEYLVLAMLWECDGLRVPQLAARLRVSEGVVEGWIDALAQRGLVERDGEAEDVWLTAPGRALQLGVPRAPSALLCHVLSWLDHDEVEAAAAPRAVGLETGDCPDSGQA